MGWETKYWDTLEQVFWSLKYVGLENIPGKIRVLDDKMVCIPQSELVRGNSLFRRVRNSVEQREFMLSQEEVLNHVFDIAFGIAPDKLIVETLLGPLGFADAGSFCSHGREISKRYREHEDGQFQQQDGFFTSKQSAVGVELKLGAKSSSDQVLKYAMLIALEEIHSGPKQQIGLLYITPDPSDSHWRACGLKGPALSSKDISLAEQANSKLVRDFYARNRDKMEAVFDRMVLHAISWVEFSRSLTAFRENLDSGSPGDQCLIRLLDGVIGQIANHKMTGVES